MSWCDSAIKQDRKSSLGVPFFLFFEQALLSVYNP